MSPAESVLVTGLEELEAAALLVVAESSRDPDLAAFVGDVHLGQAAVLWKPGSGPVLSYLVDMERGEAASSDLELAPPPPGLLARLRSEGASSAEVWSRVLAGALESIGLDGGRIALAGHAGAGATHAAAQALAGSGFAFVDGHPLVRRLRKAKSGREIEGVRRAARGTCAAFRAVAELLAAADSKDRTLVLAGRVLTAGELRKRVSLTLAESGLEQPEGNIVACGADAGVPHTRGDDERALRAGESIIVDLFPKGELFADCTRTFCVGGPPEELARAHDLCRRALETARSAAVAGAVAADLQTATCDLFEGAGYATIRSEPRGRVGYVHGLGHGVGYQLHELPSFRKARGSDGVLADGDVFTLEPGLYDPGAGYGVRLEDLLVLTAAGPECLTELPYDLDPRAWSDH